MGEHGARLSYTSLRHGPDGRQVCGLDCDGLEEQREHEGHSVPPRSLRGLPLLVRFLLVPSALVVMFLLAAAVARRSSARLQRSRMRDSEVAVVLARTAQTLPAVVAVRGLVRNRRGACLHAKLCCGAAPWVAECDRDMAQQWEFTSQGLLRHDIGGCLDRGGALHMWKCNASNPHQLWAYDTESGLLKSREKDAFCLQISEESGMGSLTVLSTCRRVPAQGWSLGVRIGALQLAADSCLLAEGGAAALGRCSPGPHAMWELDVSAGRLLHLASGLCLEASRNGSIGLRTCSDSPSNALWEYDPATSELRTAEGACLGDGGSKGEELGLRPCARMRRRAWRVGLRLGQIQHRRGFCLGAGSAGLAGRPLVQTPCDSAQSWSYHDETGTIRDSMGSCLEVFRPFSVAVSPCRRDASTQQWFVDDASKQVSHNGLCLSAAAPRELNSTVKLAWCDAKGSSSQREYVFTDHGRTSLFLTIETRTSERLIQMPGSTWRTIWNYGVGQPWKGFRTKPSLYLAALQGLAKTDPQRIAIMTDSDILDGGCTDRDLVDRYRKLVNASGGAPVVVSGDVNQYPAIPSGKEKFNTTFGGQRAKVMRAFGLSADAMDAYKEPKKATTYGFVNSGFVMGPIVELEEILRCVLEMGLDRDCLAHPECPRTQKGNGKECCFDDQLGWTRCSLMHPDKVTIDFPGALVISTFALKVMVRIEQGRLVSDITNGTQCFVHSNGDDLYQPVKWDTWLEAARDKLSASRSDRLLPQHAGSS